MFFTKCETENIASDLDMHWIARTFDGFCAFATSVVHYDEGDWAPDGGLYYQAVFRKVSLLTAIYSSYFLFYELFYVSIF